MSDVPFIETTRKRVMRRKAALWADRASWFDHWREISEYQQPRLGRFFESDSNDGRKRHQHIIDSTALFAARTLSSGLMSGMTSPARPWFRLGLQDRELAKSGPVRSWLFQTTTLLRAVFNKSNTYHALHSLYDELGLFGTGATIVLPNFENVIHHHALTIGEYALGINELGAVDTLVRETRMTVGQLVKQFGKANCSSAVVRIYDRGNYDERVPVVHLIQPRRDRDARKLDNRNMPFESVYIETGGNDDKPLSESGFKRFRALTPRWSVTGNDTYGAGPGMEALGDVKQLQHQQHRKSQAIDYKVNPPLQVPTSLKSAAFNRLPGGVTYVDSVGNSQAVRSAFDVDLDLSHLLADIQDVRERIRSAFYADLFLMLANETRSNVTATEVAERHEEKLLMLGPVLERLQNELLSPLIDLAFDECRDAGILPPIPEELAEQEIEVEFISTLAQAQRVVSAQSTDRFLGSVTSLMTVKPDVIDKVNFDKAIDDYAELYGTNPDIVNSADVVAELRAQRERAAAAAQAAAAAPVAADTAKTASEIDSAGLRDVMGMFSGYGSPTSTEVETLPAA